MRRRSDDLLAHVERFFRDHLSRVRGASKHTVRAYGDALRLFGKRCIDTTWQGRRWD
jgi:hypothetical protein